MNTDTLTPILFPALLRVRATLSAHPRLTRALVWLAVFSAALVVLLLAAHGYAQTAPTPPAAGGTLNSLTTATANTACTEAKSLTSNRWLKVFILCAFGAAVVGVARKQRDGWSNLIWIVVIAALVGSVWQIAQVFGIGC